MKPSNKINSMLFDRPNNSICSEEGKNSVMEKQAEYWNNKAETNFINPCNMTELHKVLPDKNAKILEYGCGYGRVLDNLSKEGYCNLYGIDFADKMIARGQKDYPHLNLIKNDGLHIPYSDNEFDAVLLFTVLTCIHDSDTQKRIMQEIRRVLKPGGILYLSDFLLSDDERNLQRYAAGVEKYQCYGVFELEGGGVCRHHSIEYIDELLSDFERQWYCDTGIPTLSGHPARPFQIIASYAPVLSSCCRPFG